MNYYPFHVGDYTTHTAHLDPIEDLAYRRMLDMYYLREEPLPASVSDVARLIRLRDHEPQVESVLSEFFHLSPDGWRQGRCDAEIGKMQDLQQKQREKANKRWRGSGNAGAVQKESTSNATAMPQQCRGNAEAMPPTPTPTPTPIPTPEGKKKASCAAPSKPKPEKPSSPVFIAIPLNSGEEYPITESDVTELQALYPAVDVPQALRNIRGWALANPTKRKTRAGVRRFVNAWLAKDQDKGQHVVQLHPPARTFREVSL